MAVWKLWRANILPKVDANKNLIFAVNGVAITDENSAKIEYNAMMDSQGNLFLFG